MKLTYRPEIDGLRTIAVLAVIFYHADIHISNTQLFKGGFFGVDIFFVISGFLITSIIKNELNLTNKFSIVNFYERRARRLLPALLAVILLSLPFGWYFLLPSQLIDFSKSILSSLAFGSNFYWDLTLQEYGAESANLKPFLHTWSLAIEEQYYIFYPLALMAIHRWFKKHVIVILLASLLLSLQFAEYTTASDVSFSFYMLPSRLWELIAGGLLAHFFAMHPQKDNDALLNKTMPIIGLFLIAHSILFIDFDSNHPGFITLVPVIGTVLIIWFANGNELVTKILSSKPFVNIGLISYSLYLWHWPVFVFGRIDDPTPTWHDKLFWILITFILSLVSYFLIEKISRSREKCSFRLLLIIFFLLTLIISYFTISWIRAIGAPERIPPIIGKLFNNEITSSEYPELLSSYLQKRPEVKSIYALGDSHINALQPGIKSALPAGRIMEDRASAGCPYAFGTERYNIKSKEIYVRCNAEVQKSRRLHLLHNRKSLVITGGYMPLYFTGKRLDYSRRNNFEQYDIVMKKHGSAFESFEQSLNDFKKAYKSSLLELAEYGHTIALIYPIPEPGYEVPKKLLQKIRYSSVNEYITILKDEPLTSKYSTFKERSQKSYDFLDSIKHKNIYRIYPEKLFCNKNSNTCSTHNLKEAYYQDTNHVSGYGARMILNEVARTLDH